MYDFNSEILLWRKNDRTYLNRCGFKEHFTAKHILHGRGLELKTSAQNNIIFVQSLQVAFHERYTLVMIQSTLSVTATHGTDQKVVVITRWCYGKMNYNIIEKNKCGSFWLVGVGRGGRKGRFD